MAKSREQYIAERSDDYDTDLATFSLVDEKTVKRLVDDGDIELPYKDLDKIKDKRWNTKQMSSKLLQGILNGDPVDKIAQSLIGIVSNNEAAAMRNARTMITGAENRGRLDSYNELDEQGVIQKKVWIATPDDRTRESHLEIDGEEMDIGDKFTNGLDFPGDPSGDPSEVYNCRCTMVDRIVGFRRADGTISYIDAERDSTTHDRQIDEERERRGIEQPEAESKQPAQIEIKTRQEAYEVAGTMFGSIEKNMSRVDEKLLCENITQLKKLNDRFGVLTDKNMGYLTSKASGRAIAYTGTAYNRKAENTRLGLVAKHYGDKETFVAQEIRMRDRNWSMPFTDDNASVFSITHEYGHMLESFVSKGRTEWGSRIGPDYVDNPRYEEKVQAHAITKEILAIAKESNPDFKLADNISQYGKTNDFEFFAEVFANSQCGAPNELGDAMNKWLKKEGF